MLGLCVCKGINNLLNYKGFSENSVKYRLFFRDMWILIPWFVDNLFLSLTNMKDYKYELYYIPINPSVFCNFLPIEVLIVIIILITHQLCHIPTLPFFWWCKVIYYSEGLLTMPMESFLSEETKGRLTEKFGIIANSFDIRDWRKQYFVFL